MPKLVVFLGNPGSQYKKTRHNTAWLFSDYLHLGTAWQTKFHSQFIKLGNTIYLKPQTFMNESGIAVQEASSFFSVKSQDIIVVHDDIEKQFGDVLLEQGGGLRGHNGLRSIAQHLGKDDFYRLRLGVGRPQNMDVASYVLSRFSELEEASLENVFEKAKMKLQQETDK